MQAIIALSAAGLIEKYGAYAGLAAIPGLAVLSLLYFAQAREVRRLREWAGRAPERDIERSTSGVHVAPTGARDPVSVVRRQPPPSAGRPRTPAPPRARPPPPPPPGRPPPPPPPPPRRRLPPPAPRPLRPPSQPRARPCLPRPRRPRPPR